MEGTAWQGKDTYGFLPLHPFLPFVPLRVRSPRSFVFARADSGSLRPHPPDQAGGSLPSRRFTLLTMTAPTDVPSLPDQFSSRYPELIDGTYDCVDRIVLNARFPLARDGGGMRFWWRQLFGSDETLDTNHLMRMAGRFSRRLRAYAEAQGIPVEECAAGEEKWKIAQTYMASHPIRPGLFLVLVSRAPAPVWEVKKARQGGHIAAVVRKHPWPYVKHYSFHILDPDWGHVVIKMSGHPPFGAQIILNGHEYVACQASKKGLPFRKEGNCFVQTADPAGLAVAAETLTTANATGLLRQVCDRWIYSACLWFGLSLEEQERSGFRYEYTTYQCEYSRNYQFHSGRRMEEVIQALIERTRGPLGLDQVKTVFGCKKRPSRKRLDRDRYETVVETPEYGVTVFKVHYGKLTLKIYTKGEHVLRIEVMVHNTEQLGSVKRLDRFVRVVAKLKNILTRFTAVIHCIDASFIGSDLLEQLPQPAQLGQTRVGGLDLNQVRLRRAIQATLTLAVCPRGFTTSEVVAKVRQIAGPSGQAYGPRQAAYDLKKLRAKGLAERIGHSHRYALTEVGIRALTALLVLREKVIQPLLANACHRKRGARPTHHSPLDRCYDTLQAGMQVLFKEVGIAA